jgi:hypothetical protein
MQQIDAAQTRKRATVLALNNKRVLGEHAAEIRRLGKRVIADVVEIGRRLTECKELVGHGGWLPWLNHEFGWSDRQALNYMRVYEMVTKSENFADLVTISVSGLYMLAAPSTPESARDEILDRAGAGEQLAVADVKKTIQAHKAAPMGELHPEEPAQAPAATIEEQQLDNVVKHADFEPPEPAITLCDLAVEVAMAALCQLIFAARHGPRLTEHLTAAVVAQTEEPLPLSGVDTVVEVLGYVAASMRARELEFAAHQPREGGQ